MAPAETGMQVNCQGKFNVRLGKMGFGLGLDSRLRKLGFRLKLEFRSEFDLRVLVDF